MEAMEVGPEDTAGVMEEVVELEAADQFLSSSAQQHIKRSVRPRVSRAAGQFPNKVAGVFPDRAVALFLTDSADLFLREGFVSQLLTEMIRANYQVTLTEIRLRLLMTMSS